MHLLKKGMHDNTYEIKRDDKNTESEIRGIVNAELTPSIFGLKIVKNTGSNEA